MTEMRLPPHRITIESRGCCRDRWWSWTCSCGDAGIEATKPEASAAGERHVKSAQGERTS